MTATSHSSFDWVGRSAINVSQNYLSLASRIMIRESILQRTVEIAVGSDAPAAINKGTIDRRGYLLRERDRRPAEEERRGH
jgi:hypothetical protein